MFNKQSSTLFTNIIISFDLETRELARMMDVTDTTARQYIRGMVIPAIPFLLRLTKKLPIDIRIIAGRMVVSRDKGDTVLGTIQM